MNYVRGSAIKLFFEVDIATGTTGFVDYIKDPNGTEVLSDAAMSSTTSPGVGFDYIWQSSLAYTTGKYEVLFKTVNGIYPNYKKHSLFLETN